MAKREIRIPKTQKKYLPPVNYNAGIAADYTRRLHTLIQAMDKSAAYWIMARYKNNTPRIAQDASPADEMQRIIRELARRWQKAFNDAADGLSQKFAEAAKNHSDRALVSFLKDAGVTVSFRNTAAVRDIIDATVHANVALIKTIPQQYFSRIEGIVMRGVQAGSDLKLITDGIQKTYSIQRKRAAFIARDQNRKATAALNKARNVELGLTKAEWLHSGGGKTPRHTHVKMNGKIFDVREGLYDSDEGRNVMPGELINCRCQYRTVLEGLT